MDNFVRIPENFKTIPNYWELNPQHKYIEPFSSVYKKYTENKSSKLMWGVVFMEHPDDDLNKLYRLPEKERLEAVKEFFGKSLKVTDKLFIKSREAWTTKGLTEIQRLLKLKEKYISSREELIERGRIEMLEAPLDQALQILDSLDKASSKNQKIYDDYKLLVEKFKEEKENQATVYGGRRETFAERKLL